MWQVWHMATGVMCGDGVRLTMISVRLVACRKQTQHVSAQQWWQKLCARAGKVFSPALWENCTVQFTSRLALCDWPGINNMLYPEHSSTTCNCACICTHLHLQLPEPVAAMLPDAMMPKLVTVGDVCMWPQLVSHFNRLYKVRAEEICVHASRCV